VDTTASAGCGWRWLVAAGEGGTRREGKGLREVRGPLFHKLAELARGSKRTIGPFLPAEKVYVFRI